jgi:hypothetical protein
MLLSAAGAANPVVPASSLHTPSISLNLSLVLDDDTLMLSAPTVARPVVPAQAFAAPCSSRYFATSVMPASLLSYAVRLLPALPSAIC